jgi:cysteine-rich repeat protein
MRIALLVIWIAIARAAGAACVDQCAVDLGGSGPFYDACVAGCSLCGNGVLDGAEDCDDGNNAGGDCCDAACRFESAGSPCEGDDDPCTTDFCDGNGACDDEEKPAIGCREPIVPGGATLVMRDAENDAKDLLVWKWRRGQATSKAEFGEPNDSTIYALCIYDDVDGLLSAVTLDPGGTCGQHACWAERPGGFRFRSREREPEGASTLVLQHGRRDGRARIVLQASGDNLDLPDLADLASPLTVQLRRTGSSVCWAARYSFPPARRKGGFLFRDKSDPPPPSTTTTTTTTTTVPDTTSTTIAGPPTTTFPGQTTTTTTLPTTRVEVTVVDAAGAPVPDADVTISYADGFEDDEFSDDSGLAVFDGQPVGVPATITAEDDVDDRIGSATSLGFASGVAAITVTVR